MGAGILAFALVALPSGVLASTITSGGLNGGFGCTNGFQCGNGSQTFIYDTDLASGAGLDPAAGSLDLDLVNGLLDLDFDVASATFAAVGAADDGVDEIVFSSVSYVGTGLSANEIAVGSGIYAISGSVAISGFYDQFLGGAPVGGTTGFSETANVSAGQCIETGLVLDCSLVFGPGGPFSLDIGTSPVSRRFIHVVNVVSAPEPASVLLLGVGLMGLGLARRRA